MFKKPITTIILVSIVFIITILGLFIFKVNTEGYNLDEAIDQQLQIAQKLGLTARPRPAKQLEVRFKPGYLPNHDFYHTQQEYLDDIKFQNHFTFNSQVKELKDYKQNLLQKQALVDNLDLKTKVGNIPETKDFEKSEPTSTLIEDLKTFQKLLKSYSDKVDAEIESYKLEKSKNGQFSNQLWSYTDADLLRLMDQMSISEKLSQVLFVSVNFTSLSQEKKLQLNKNDLPNVIIMGSNIQNQSQLTKLNQDLQSVNPVIPIFIGVDQEGGVVKRLVWEDSPGQKVWSGLSDQQVCKIGTDRAILLKKLGFNFNFSPVVDLTNPDPKAFINERTISADPQIVASKSQSYINCHQKEGVLTTLKHFPGHGSSVNDTHTQIATVSMTRQQWLAKDAIPFINIKNAGAIMIGHLIYSKIDTQPASQSGIFINDILKGELNYNGLVVTDDLKMLHQVVGKSDVELVKNALNAGADIAMYISDEDFSGLKSRLEKEVLNGAIDVKTLNKTVLKILIAKRSLK